MSNPRTTRTNAMRTFIAIIAATFVTISVESAAAAVHHRTGRPHHGHVHRAVAHHRHVPGTVGAKAAPGTTTLPPAPTTAHRAPESFGPPTEVPDTSPAPVEPPEGIVTDAPEMTPAQEAEVAAEEIPE
jgi:hypothetical protein